MVNRETLYSGMMALATTYGAGYSAAHEDWFKVACYTLIAAEFIMRLKKMGALESKLS